MMWMVKLFIYWLALKSTSEAESIELEIAQGKVNGLKNKTVYHGISFYSFRGIPYAKPNVGPDKFNVAQPLDSWSGVLDATKHGQICPQQHKKKVFGHEDCLFLNVYTPDLNETAGRAVMVFIHGGAFQIGSGNDWHYGPDFLVEKDIVLVTINYRLGVIGFLNTEDVSAPGNVGLKDQNLALKWVQKNIIKFSGCPKRVTIFGQGSGAASVHYHILSPMSKGLFKGAILQSGAAVNPRAFTYTPTNNAKLLAHILEINATDMTEVVDKLKNMNLKDFSVEVLKILWLHYLFIPSVEVLKGGDAFLPDNPWKLMTTGEISDVPIMVGSTETESEHRSNFLISLMSHYKDYLAEFILNDLNVTDQVEMNTITEKYSKIYFNGLPISNNPSNITTLHSDTIINHGLLISAEILNARMSSPVYKYLFRYETNNTKLKKIHPQARGVLHGDDLTFIFYSRSLNNSFELGSSDAQMTDKIVEMWTNFAKEGNPSVAENTSGVVWTPMGETKSYLAIGTELEMKTNLWEDRVQLWGHLYKNFIGDYIKLFE